MASHKAEADEQPEITIVNINAETTPKAFRCAHYDVSAPSTVVSLAKFLQEEDALIINMSLSPKHLCLVAAFKRDDWVARFQSAV